jgi:hypothetical protein
MFGRIKSEMVMMEQTWQVMVTLVPLSVPSWLALPACRTEMTGRQEKSDKSNVSQVRCLENGEEK